MATASAMRSILRRGRSKVTPMAAYSAAFQPAPMPISRRPPLSTSRVARSCASTAGWRRSLFRTKVPILTLSVAAAIVARAGIGASCSRR